MLFANKNGLLSDAAQTIEIFAMLKKKMLKPRKFSDQLKNNLGSISPTRSTPAPPVELCGLKLNASGSET